MSLRQLASLLLPGLFVAADAEADRFAERADSRMRGVVLSAAPPLGGDGLVVEVAPDLLEAPIASAAAPIAPTRAEHPTCAFTIDVEDWYQSSVDYDAAITDRVVRNVDRVCELLDACGVRGTFFIQGMVAEAFPQMIRDLLSQGHEIQSHGYSHRPLYKMDRAALRTELERARKSVEDAGGVRINSFRAPDFSILPENLWALESLAENGFEIDSSIFPMKTRRYGVPGWGLEPRIVPLANGAEIFEVPVAMARMGPVVLPVAGGGYFRLLPRVILETACRSILGEGRPVIIYCHPYEFNPREMDDYRGHVPDLYRIHQSIGRNSFVGRLRALFSGLPFGRLDQVLAGWRARA